MKHIIITICARGGSKGIPGKNIKLLNDKNLIQYTIEHANEIKLWFEKEKKFVVFIALSTDDTQIRAIAKENGLKTNYLRPDYLANDTAGKLDVIVDILNYSKKENNCDYDYLLDLDVSAPMRTQEDLKEGFKIIENKKGAENLFSVNKANKNPYFNMVEKNQQGFYDLSKKGNLILSRQKAPKVYSMNASFYYYKRSFFENKPLNLFNKALIFEMKHLSFDLDEVVDFEFLEFLIRNNKLKFKI